MQGAWHERPDSGTKTGFWHRTSRFVPSYFGTIYIRMPVCIIKYEKKEKTYGKGDTLAPQGSLRRHTTLPLREEHI